MLRQGWKGGGAVRAWVSPDSFSCSLASSRLSFSFWTSARRASQSILDVSCFASWRLVSRSFVVRCNFSSSISFSMKVFCTCASFFSSSCSLSSLSWSNCGYQRRDAGRRLSTAAEPVRGYTESSCKPLARHAGVAQEPSTRALSAISGSLRLFSLQ